jgi:hypothetical protein
MVGWFLESKKINTRQYSDFIKKRIPKTSSEERKPPNTVKNLFYNDPRSFLSSINKPVYSSRVKDGVRNKTNVIDIANYLMAKSERSKRTEIKKFIGNDTIDEFWLELTKRILISFFNAYDKFWVFDHGHLVVVLVLGKALFVGLVEGVWDLGCIILRFNSPL